MEVGVRRSEVKLTQLGSEYDAIPIEKQRNSSNGRIIEEIHEIMKMPTQLSSKNTIPLEVLKNRIKNRKVDSIL